MFSSQTYVPECEKKMVQATSIMAFITATLFWTHLTFNKCKTAENTHS